jgi:purine catabolism regulator
MSLDSALDRGVTWAASIRAAPPHLPQLRGDELLVLPLRVLEQIELGEELTREGLLEQIIHQPIAAILTEPAFSEDPIDQVPLLTLPAPIQLDAEGNLNRLITEKRAELYRLGADLSRRLSHASVDPRGIAALLESASELTRPPLLLEDRDGNVVAQSGEAPLPSGQRVIGRARVVDGTLYGIEEDGIEYLIVTLSAGGRSGYLSMSGEPGTLTEGDRLVLVQTAGMCVALLGEQTRLPSSERSARARQSADLRLGRLATSAAALARGQALGIGTGDEIVVGLLESKDEQPNLNDAREIVARALGPGPAGNLTVVDGTVGLLLPNIDVGEAKRALERALTHDTSETVIALSKPLPNVVQAPDGLREARFALGLRKQGALTGRVINGALVDDLGLYEILYPLWGHPALSLFQSALLGELEAYDRQHKAELIKTLDAYLSTGGALSEAAALLGIHRNTLSYRLQRIGELTGRDLSLAQERLLLHVALIARRMPPFLQSTATAP